MRGWIGAVCGVLLGCGPDGDHVSNAEMLRRIEALEGASTGTNTVSELEDRIAILEGQVAECATKVEMVELTDKAVQLLDVDPEPYMVTNADELLSALAELDRYRIGSGATVTIKLAAGTYTFSEALKIRHPDGAAIRIEGDTSRPSTVVLDFGSLGTATAGIILESGQALGYLGGVTVQGAGSGAGSGLSLERNATITLGPVVVSDWYSGMYVGWGGVQRADPDGWFEAMNCTEGVFAEYGAALELDSASLHNNLDSGAFLQYASVGKFSGARASDNGGFGINARVTSTLLAVGLEASNNGLDGIRANEQVYVDATNGAFSGNGEFQINVDGGVMLAASGATLGVSINPNSECQVVTNRHSLATLTTGVIAEGVCDNNDGQSVFFYR